MNQNKQQAISFLKELDKQVEAILNDSESIILLVKRIYDCFDEWLEQNPDISRTEGFRNLEKDVRTLFQTCRFITKDCVDIRHSINDCSVELN